jgi:hypothetical protein
MLPSTGSCNCTVLLLLLLLLLLHPSADRCLPSCLFAHACLQVPPPRPPGAQAAAGLWP